MIFEFDEFTIWRKHNPLIEIVATNGCFDLLHIGHVHFLTDIHRRFPKSTLVVGINSNDSVRYLKGNERPIFNERERAEMVNAIFCVDITVVFDDVRAINFLTVAKPRWWIKGADYTLDTLDSKEKEVVLKNGGEIVLIPHRSKWSTTKIVQQYERCGCLHSAHRA